MPGLSAMFMGKAGTFAMMCTPGGVISELEFVQRSTSRQPGECIGPVIKLSIPSVYLDFLEEGLDGTGHWPYLIASYCEESTHLIFGLCVLHWLEITSILWTHGVRDAVHDWRRLSQSMLQTVCKAAGLDPKEISNFFAWQHVELAE